MIYELASMTENDVHAVNLSCARSYVYYHESKYYSSIFDDMFVQTGLKWKEAVRWWVSNSARAIRKNARGFTFSMDYRAYTGSKQGIGYRGVKEFTSFLESKGYIDIYKGYVSSWKVVKGKRTPENIVPSCIIFKKRTLDMWDGVNTRYNLWKDLEENDLAVIRNRETKEALPSRGVSGFKDIKTGVKVLNSKLEGADITFDGRPIADVAYRRIFSGDINTGGRLYTLGGGVQLLPQHVRSSSLRIDGERVVELDYSAIHPSICYQQMYNDGLNVYDVLGEGFSPYDADLSFIQVDQQMKEEIEKETGVAHNPTRTLAKLAILMAMNSDDKNSAAWTLGNKVKQDREKAKKDQMFYAMIGKVDYGRVLDAVHYHNDLISDRFFSDGGIVLQNIDSRIMMNIVGAMGEKGHTILCYHDSALVKESAKQDLYNAMIKAWKDVLGDTTFCKVEEK